MKTINKLTTTITVAEIEQMLITKARQNISEDFQVFPDEKTGKVAWNEDGNAIVSLEYEIEH